MKEEHMSVGDILCTACREKTEAGEPKAIHYCYCCARFYEQAGGKGIPQDAKTAAPEG